MSPTRDRLGPIPGDVREPLARSHTGGLSVPQPSWNSRIVLLALGVLLVSVCRASALDFLDDRVHLHGYYESQLRFIDDQFHTQRIYGSRWANVLHLELEADIAPEGWGPFSLISAYVGVTASYDCIWTRMCGLVRNYPYWGDRAEVAPQNDTNGRAPTRTGAILLPEGTPPTLNRLTHTYVAPGGLISQDARLVPLPSVSPFDTLLALGNEDTVGAIEETLAPILDMGFAPKAYGGTIEPDVLPMGPWNTGVTIRPNAALQSIPNRTPQDLALRPLIGAGQTALSAPRGARGIYVPSAALRERRSSYGEFDQNFSQNELALDWGASQEQTKVLREAYLDFELFDGRLFTRLGRQTIVWGKTELFRNQDQFNALDLGTGQFLNLEESRVPAWALRSIYSLDDVGPFQDVRLELALNLAQFEPTDVGRCGEPYTIFLVCGKSVGLVAHGVLGIGIAGERRPPSPYSEVEGIQGGMRLEWRWDRFSFAVTDYYGYSDLPTIKNFNVYERKVDPVTGQPLDVRGLPLDASDPNVRTQALNYGAGNRQFFDVFCSASIGIASNALPIPGADLSQECALTIFSSQTVIPGVGPVARAIGAVLAGGIGGQAVLNGTLAQVDPTLAPPFLATLNRDPNDVNPSPNGGGAFGMSGVLTDPQEALLGCGPYYGRPCSAANPNTIQGIDLFNAEASVLFQAFPMFEQNAQGQPGGPIATRYAGGHVRTLPGAGGPFTTLGRPYDPRVDGCVSPTIDGVAPAGYCSGAQQNLLSAPTDVNGNPLLNPSTGLPMTFQSELQALSFNLLELLAAFGKAGDPTGPCQIDQPATCAFVRAFISATGTQRPELKAGGNGQFGRRDFLWASGSELEISYRKRNVLGFSTDLAEDVSKTNWSIEFTYVSGEDFLDNSSWTGSRSSPTYNLTVSVDRPTFINFLNPNRTFLFNTQWFFRYIPNYVHGNAFQVDGPLTALGTFNIFTGYFQDRLLTVLTLVHDLKSNSGAVLPLLSYRFTASFSVALGVSLFYGHADQWRVPLVPVVLRNDGGSFKERTAYPGLSALAERDDVFFTLRYAF